MAFDAVRFVPAVPAVEPVVAEDVLCPVWAAQNPDRALAFLLVAPQDGIAVDVLTAA